MNLLENSAIEVLESPVCGMGADRGDGREGKGEKQSDKLEFEV